MDDIPTAPDVSGTRALHLAHGVKALLRSALLWLSLLMTSIATLADDAAREPIEVGQTRVRTLENGDVHHYRLPTAGHYRIAVDALERGAILAITDDDGQTLLRSGSWRGSEGTHAAVLQTDGPVNITVTPDAPISPAGRYALSVSFFDRYSIDYEAHLAMSRGADLHLRHYYGEADARRQAREQFQRAAARFAATGNVAGQATATYELASVNHALREHHLAAQQYLEAAELFSQLEDRAGVAKSQNERGLALRRMGESVTAITALEEAIRIRESIGPPFFLAQALNNLGLVYKDQGDALLAFRFFEQALQGYQVGTDVMAIDVANTDLTTLRPSPHLKHAIVALTNLGWASESVADTNEAQRYYDQALSLAQTLGRGEATAKLQSNLGHLWLARGDLDGALDYFLRSLAYFRGQSRDEYWEAKVHHNLARTHMAAGDDERARTSAREALSLRPLDRDPTGRLETLVLLAKLDHRAGIAQTGSPYLREALEAPLADVNPRVRGEVLALAGDTALAANTLTEADAHYEAAMDAYRLASDLHGEARARIGRVIVGLRQGSFVTSEIKLDAALRILRTIEDPLSELALSTSVAREYARAGKFDRAHRLAAAAATLGENLRRKLTHPSLRREFAAAQRSAYEVMVHSLVQIGDTDAAWNAASLSRARRFSELVQQSEAEYAQLDETELSRLKELRTLVSTKVKRRSELLALRELGKAEHVRLGLMPLLAELQELEQRRDEALLDAPNNASLAAFQALLGADDLVLDYFVGEFSGGLWEITRETARFHPLPNALDLGRPVLKAARTFRSRQDIDRTALDALHATLLAPVTPRLASAQRLVIIPDGPLHYLPFVVLTAGTDSSDVPISYLPSAQALVALRARSRREGSGVIVLADPVFDANDARVARAKPRARRSSGGTPSRGAGPSRLPATRDEAEAIRRVAQSVTDVEVLLGMNASKRAIVEGVLNHYRFIHFATHGKLDLQEPVLAGLALAGLSPTGVPQTSVLRALDVMRLPLSADLVVLSGCDTGDGKPVRGEGLLSLSRAFFYAGARQVVSSLWRVPDEVTATLMSKFYEEVLKHEATPAQALRTAQLAVREAYPHPRHWAAFVVQGDWSSSSTLKARTGPDERHESE